MKKVLQNRMALDILTASKWETCAIIHPECCVFIPDEFSNTTHLFFFFLIFIYFYLFLAVLGLRLCARAFSSCGKWGPLFIAVRGPPTIAASPVAEHRLQTRRLSNCGSRAQPLRGTWDPPRPGLEPVSPASAGRFSTTVPPGKPITHFITHTKNQISALNDPLPNLGEILGNGLVLEDLGLNLY